MNSRWLISTIAIGLAAFPAAAVSFHVSPDVPTDDPSGVALPFLPWDVVRVDGVSGTYAVVLAFPGGTPVNALHGMCNGSWLLSVEAPTDLGGISFEARDVILYDPVSIPGYSAFFCGAGVGLPDGVDVDAAFLEGDDASPLVLSFDVPTDLTALGGGVYDPSDLVRFVPTGGGGCAGWAPAGLYFDASAAAPVVALAANVTGADVRGSTVMTFDVPTTLGASTFLPGELVSWDGATFAALHFDPGWSISSRVDALAFPADPGSVPAVPPNKIHLAKPPGFPPTIRITWSASSSAGAEDYGIYEGTIGSWYSHTSLLCHDAGADFVEDFTPQAASSYYLVVPLNANDEGSYGLDSSGAERPVGASVCRASQGLSCP